MLHRTAIWTALAVAACVGVPVEADELKTADEVIAKYIEAIGGRQKIDAVKSIRSTGKSTFSSGMEAPLVMELKRPDKIRIEFTFQDMTAVQAFDGKTGWFIMPFMGKTEPEKMPPEQLKMIKGQADMDGPLVDYRKKGHKVELIGKETLDGKEAYKLKVTKKNNDVEYHYLDAEHLLPIKVTGKMQFQGTEFDYEISFGDYKKVAGLLIPHSITQRIGPMGGSTITFEKMEVNVNVADDRFTMPQAAKPPAAEKLNKTASEDK